MTAPPEQNQPAGQAAHSISLLRPERLPTVPSGHLVGAEEPEGQKECSGQSAGWMVALALHSLPAGHLPAHWELL